MLNFVKPMLLPGYPWVPSKKFSPLGPAVWPALADIYMSKELYCIEDYILLFNLTLGSSYFKGFYVVFAVSFFEGNPLYKVVIFVCLFGCPIITQKPLDQFASNFKKEFG